MDDKSPFKTVWSGSRDQILNFAAPNDLLGTAEARIIKFCTPVDYSTVTGFKS